MHVFESMTIAGGDLVFAIGDLAEHLYFIEEGTVDLVNRQGTVFAQVSGGKSFGEAAILQGGVRSASARANGQVVCKRISATQASELLLSQSPLLVTVLEALLLQQSMSNALRNP